MKHKTATVLALLLALAAFSTPASANTFQRAPLHTGPGETSDCQDTNGCSWECYNEPQGAECKRQQQCERTPNAGPLCTGDRIICSDGSSTGWDTDGDGYCDSEDVDDDGDGVLDNCDPSPMPTIS